MPHVISLTYANGVKSNVKRAHVCLHIPLLRCMLTPFIAFTGFIWSVAAGIALVLNQRGHIVHSVEHNKLTHYTRHAAQILKLINGKKKQMNLT